MSFPAGDVYAHGDRKSARRKSAPSRRTRSSTCDTTSKRCSGVSVMGGEVSVMVLASSSRG